VRGRKPHDPRFDGREALDRATGVDLTAVEGIDAVPALTLVSERGSDLSKGPTVKHVTSWLGLCPNWRKTGGKVPPSRTRLGQNRAAAALRLAAWDLVRSPSYLGAYRRRQSGAIRWPGKAGGTFSDALTAVRRWVWAEAIFAQAEPGAGVAKLAPMFRELLLTAVAPAP
jgi:hypothetical protein